MSPTAIEIALSQAREVPLVASKDRCEGKTYIVTGANVGLGLEAARHLLGFGAGKVIMAVRNLEAGQAARESVEASTGTKGVAEVWHLDLSSFASVRAFVSRATKTLDRIDAVIENAGVAGVNLPPAEGHSMMVTVNVLSTLLLALLLLPKLRSDAKQFGFQPRLSIVTSGTAIDMGDYWSSISEDPIVKMDADGENPMKAYPTSKLMEILAVHQMARLLPVSQGGVIINCINPGLCETSLSRNAPAAFRDQLRAMWARSGRTAECGSRTLLAGAVANEESHGCYMDDCVPADNTLPEWINEAADKAGWAAIAKELEKIEPGCASAALGKV